jgi:hypothetical protein
MAKQKKIPESYLKQVALLMTVNCVRNTVIEEFHSRGSLSQSDMKAFNKEVANKIYTWQHFNLNGTPEEQEALFKFAGMFYPSDWDKPELDKDMVKAIKMLIKNPSLLDIVNDPKK